jgi:hypothetical protein
MTDQEVQLLNSVPWGETPTEEELRALGPDFKLRLMRQLEVRFGAEQALRSKLELFLEPLDIAGRDTVISGIVKLAHEFADVIGARPLEIQLLEVEEHLNQAINDQDFDRAIPRTPPSARHSPTWPFPNLAARDPALKSGVLL